MSNGASSSPLRAEGLSAGYGADPVLRDLDLDVVRGEFTVIVGPNASGKSTLLRTLGRLLSPKAGTVLLDGQSLHRLPGKEVARRLGLLPQGPSAPDGLVVSDLVARGRYPHQRLLRPWSDADARAVQEAMCRTGIADLADRQVEELSGGQRQRVWLAMVLAQGADLLLLDEPTTYLDVAHQIEVLDLCDDLHRAGQTVVAVLHDLNLAFRYAQTVVVMAQGRIVAQGPTEKIIDAGLIEAVFDLPCQVMPDPQSGTPMVIPLTRAGRAGGARRGGPGGRERGSNPVIPRE